MTCEKCWKDLYSKEDFDKHMKFCTGFVNDMCESESQVKNKENTNQDVRII